MSVVLEFSSGSAVIQVPSGGDINCVSANSSTGIDIAGEAYRCGPGGDTNLTGVTYPNTLSSGGPTGTPPPPLPVTLVSFSATRLDRGLRLEWVTASELNNSHFVLRRSTDGQHYTEVTTVPGAGTSTREQRYSAVDETVTTGANWYTLSQVDFDGTTTVYGPIVYREGGELAPIVAPNPVRSGEAIQLSFGSELGGLARVMLIDASGRAVVSTQLIAPAKSQQQLMLRGVSLAPGTYVVSVELGGRQAAARVVVY